MPDPKPFPRAPVFADLGKQLLSGEWRDFFLRIYSSVIGGGGAGASSPGIGEVAEQNAFFYMIMGFD